MGSIVRSVTNVVSDVFDAGGDALGSITDVAKDVVGAGGQIVEGGVDVLGNVVEAGGDFIDDAGKVVSDLDFEDALTTYVTTGGNPYAAAFAATSGDEKLGFNPAVFYDPSSSSFGFADPGVYGGGAPDFPSYPGQGIIEPFVTSAVRGFVESSLESDAEQSAQMQQLANLTLEQAQDLQQRIESGVYDQAPSLSYDSIAPIDSNIMGRYDQAKANLSNIIRPPGILGMDERLGIYENYFQEKGLI